jgi:hypothetical protein
VGQAWLTAPRAPRSTLRLGLSLRCRLSSARRRRGSCHADGKCRGDVTASGRNQPQSRPGAHAVLVFDGAGYHTASSVRAPHNLTLLRLPPYAPELNPIENVWEYLRANKLAITVFDDYDDIVTKTCDAWNFFANDPDRIASITSRTWATVNH